LLPAIWSELTLGLLATIILKLFPFCQYVLFPLLLQFFKCILEVVFCEGFSTACDSASVTSVVSKWRPFSFVFGRGNRKVVWVADDSHGVLGQKVQGEKGNVRLCIVLIQ
jgi:hypothetical protein